jgi:phenylacetate-CoA ligase
VIESLLIRLAERVERRQGPRVGAAYRLFWTGYTAWYARREKRLPFLPFERLLAMQAAQVRRVVRHAWQQVPYYGETMKRLGLRPEDFRTAVDLAKLPVLERDELLDEPERFTARNYRNRTPLRAHSSGTSGRARYVDYTHSALFRALAHGMRRRLGMRSTLGRAYGYRELVLAREDGLSAQIRNFFDTNMWTPRRLDLRRLLLSPHIDSVSELVERINEFRPDVIRAYGSVAGILFRRAREQGLRLHRPGAVVYGGDSMPEADRQLIEHDYGVPVYSTYQSAEALQIAFTCEERRGFHISVDDVALRVLRDDGSEALPGESGHLILSNLTNFAMVILNYRIGDMVALGAGRCRCGRNLALLERIDGRSDDLVATPAGGLFHSLSLLPLVQKVEGIVQVQLVQTHLDRVVIRAVSRRDASRAAAAQRMLAELRSRLGDGMRIEVEWVDVILPGANSKVKAVVSEVANGGQGRKR